MTRMVLLCGMGEDEMGKDLYIVPSTQFDGEIGKYLVGDGEGLKS
jgi:hypothetical protein